MFLIKYEKKILNNEFRKIFKEAYKGISKINKNSNKQTHT